MGGIGYFFSKLAKIFTFGLYRGGAAADDAANSMFTGSHGNRKAGIKIAEHSKMEALNTLIAAVAPLNTEVKRLERALKETNAAQKDAMKKRDGALIMARQAQQSSNTQEMEKAKDMFARFNQKALQLETAYQKDMARYDRMKENLKKQKANITQMQRDLQEFRSQATEILAESAANQELLKAEKQLAGIEADMNAGEDILNAIRTEGDKLSSELELTQIASGRDEAFDEKKLEKLAEKASSDDLFEKMLKASSDKEVSSEDKDKGFDRAQLD